MIFQEFLLILNLHLRSLMVHDYVKLQYVGLTVLVLWVKSQNPLVWEESELAIRNAVLKAIRIGPLDGSTGDSNF